MFFLVVVLFVVTTVMTLLVTSMMIVVMVAMAVMGRRAKQSLLHHVVCSVRKYTVLDVPAQQALLREGCCILEGVISPSVHPAEEKRSVSLTSHILVQVELEKFLGSSLMIHF
jgi:cbb3-type cytochrome oxidase cytochrome c subunit